MIQFSFYWINSSDLVILSTLILIFSGLFYTLMIKSATTTARKTFEYIAPPLTTAAIAIALYHISQQARPREEKALQAAGVAFLGTLVLCASSSTVQEIFEKEFWDGVASIFFSSTNLEPVEVLTRKLLIFSTDRIQNNPSLEALYTELQLLSAYQGQIQTLRAEYYEELELDLEHIAQEMRAAHQDINYLELSLLDKLQILAQKNLLNRAEKNLLRSLTAKRRVYGENHTALTITEVIVAMQDQKQRAKKQSEKEFNRALDYLNCPFNPIPLDTSWDKASIDSFEYKMCIPAKNAAICEVKGKRNYMEDASLVVEINISIAGKIHRIPLWGVFDGHLGSQGAEKALKASDYVNERLPAKLKEKIEHFLTKLSATTLTDEVLYNALRHALIELHEEYPGVNGTTVNIGLIANNAIYAANIGDSRSVFVDNQGNGIQLTEDAEADNPRHKKIINDLGGKVLFKGNSWRISGITGMGSALGDPEITGINPTVDITKTPIPPEGGIYLAASDGLWDAVSSKNACKILYDNRDSSASNLAKNMLYSAWLAGSEDNMSAIVLKIPGNKS